MRSILQHTLQQSNAEGTIGRAAAALLPLVAAESRTFVAASEALLQRDAGAPTEAQTAFLATMQAVVAVATERGPLTVATKSAFEAKFFSFAESARGFLHCK